MMSGYRFVEYKEVIELQNDGTVLLVIIKGDHSDMFIKTLPEFLGVHEIPTDQYESEVNDE